ncbi:MAG: histidine kinase [Spirosomataceae bacterium]
MKINWQQKLIWGVRAGELAALIGIYMALWLLYAFTLAINEFAWAKMPFSALIQHYLISQGIDYLLKFALTLPIWYLYFRVIPHWSPQAKLLLHLITLVLFVMVWKSLFYWLMELLGRGHLQGSSQVWDIYIPGLIYIIEFGFFHAYEYHQQVQKQKEVEAQLRQATLESELSAIKAQLNPHFLYNVFNTISASVPPEMETTREMIAKLADLFRYQLRASRENFVSLRDEIDFINNYLSLEKDRFGDRLTIKIDISPALWKEKIPPMILQPLVENAIKHGLSSLIEGGTVGISVKKRDTHIHFEVADTGVGLSDDQEIIGKGIGLTNTNLRLEKMFGSKLQFSPNQPRGLRVSFEI